MDMLAHCVPMGVPANAQRGVHRGIGPLLRSVRWVAGGREGAWPSMRLLVTGPFSWRTGWARFAAIGNRNREMEAGRTFKPQAFAAPDIIFAWRESPPRA